MIKLDYKNYLKDKNFNFRKEYVKTLCSTKFQQDKITLSIKEKFDMLKKEYPYSIIFYDIDLKNIIFVKPDNIKCLISKIELRIIEQSKIKYVQSNKRKVFTYKVKKVLTDIFKYKDKFQPKITEFFTNNFNFKTCFYCNKEFITNFKKDKDTYTSTFQLDHFYDKATYPYLALSFYNLIPSCSTCNSSKVKGTKNCFKYDKNIGKFENETCLVPNNKDFDFDDKVKFKLFLSDKCKNLHIKSKDDIEIPLKENYSNKYDKYIKVFKLNERYKAHKDIVYEMIEKAELYPESRLKELENLTGIPYNQIKKDILNLIDENEDLSKKPFSKLTKDISQELGII